MKNFIKTTIKEFLNENINSKFIFGKLYEYSELNSEIQKDIEPFIKCDCCRNSFYQNTKMPSKNLTLYLLSQF